MCAVDDAIGERSRHGIGGVVRRRAGGKVGGNNAEAGGVLSVEPWTPLATSALP